MLSDDVAKHNGNTKLGRKIGVEMHLLDRLYRCLGTNFRLKGGR